MLTTVASAVLGGLAMGMLHVATGADHLSAVATLAGFFVLNPSTSLDVESPPPPPPPPPPSPPRVGCASTLKVSHAPMAIRVSVVLRDPQPWRAAPPRSTPSGWASAGARATVSGRA
jgi:hypothetical protein